MERQAPFASPNIDPYALAQVHQIAMQRMQQNGGMNNFSGRPDSFGSEQEHANFPLKAEGQCQWDKNAPGVPNPLMSQPYNKAQSPYGGQMLNPQAENLEKQNMEIDYEDKPSTLSFERLEQRFLDEIRILEKEQCDAEDEENARRRERIIKINAQYQEKLSSLRAQQAKRREEFLIKETQVQLYHYKQVTLNNYPHTSPTDPRGYGPTDPRSYGSTYASQIDPYDPLYPSGYGPTNEPHGYVGAAAMETHRAYDSGEFNSSKERIPFVGPEEKVPIPEGRVYNNINR